MAQVDSADITGLLKAWPLAYAQLRAQARSYMRNEPSGATLQSTALGHEVYVRLINARDVDWHDPFRRLRIRAAVPDR